MSRRLAAKGMRRSEWWPNNAVRGWGTRTSGFRCSQRSDDTVTVVWVIGDDDSAFTEPQRRHKHDAELHVMHRKLESAYDVARVDCQSTDRDTWTVGFLVVRDK